MKRSQNPFPIKNLVSFYKVFESLEKMSLDQDENLSKYSQNLLKEMEPYPELRDGFEDFSLFETYKTQIDKLTRLLFPDVLLTNEIKGIAPPFMFEPFKKSTRFEKILSNAPKEFKFELSEFDEDLFYILGCTAILGSYYHYPASVNLPLIIEIPNEKSEQSRFYRIAFNADLTDFSPTDKAVDITENDFLLLANDFDNIDLWKEKFPQNSWIAKGVGIMNLMDVTLDQSISQITSNLLFKDTNTFDKLESNIAVLLNVKDLRLGFTAYEGQSFFQMSKRKLQSFLLETNDQVNCKSAVCQQTYDKLIEKHKPFIISDVDNYGGCLDNLLAKNLVKQGIKSYIIYPIVHENEIIGFLELASPNQNDLTTFSTQKLRDVIPVITVATARFKSEHTNRIEAVIQEECTTIHSSVKWRFLEEARIYIEDQNLGKEANFDDIVFDDVYPLYGQMDIKNSSNKRNYAVSSDLITQLNFIIEVLKEAYEKQKLPTVEELIIRTESYIQEVKEGLLAGSEQKIMLFLQSEIYPLFDLLEESIPSITPSIVKYKDELNAEIGVLYNHRRDWDQSVSAANMMMADFIDKKQVDAQEMFPHYFERYKTDGLEYNIYIGDSIAERKKFNPLYLSNLRLWQITIMCEMEREFRKLQAELNTPIEVATLILAYTTPLSINFRMDEKRFDVDGAYNTRYEIVKKRVDKAHIKGTSERITQPNKITIIYTNQEDRLEYKKYITYLEAKGLLIEGSLETHDLEDLQGITGLKALRVGVKYE
jgi:hypothetical protein